MRSIGMWTVFVLVGLGRNGVFCASRRSSSLSKEKTEPRSLFPLRTSSLIQRPCTCASTTSCSCCETVKIFYTREERRLCFNMIYQMNGLNLEIVLDSLVVKAMTVSAYRPFQMCATVPGLFFSSICVSILEINQFPRSITVCPRFEVSTKTDRWQITYVCSSISTVLPGQPTAGAMMPTSMVAAMMGAMMPGVTGLGMPAAMMGTMMPGGAAPGMTAAMMPGAARPGMPAATMGAMMPGMPAVMMPGAMMPGAARPGMPAAMGTMMPGGAAPGMPAAMMPGAMMPGGARPGMTAAMMPGGAGAGMPAAMGAMMPGGTRPGMPAAMGAMMPGGAVPGMPAAMMPGGARPGMPATMGAMMPGGAGPGMPAAMMPGGARPGMPAAMGAMMPGGAGPVMPRATTGTMRQSPRIPEANPTMREPEMMSETMPEAISEMMSGVMPGAVPATMRPSGMMPGTMHGGMDTIPPRIDPHPLGGQEFISTEPALPETVPGNLYSANSQKAENAQLQTVFGSEEPQNGPTNYVPENQEQQLVTKDIAEPLNAEDTTELTMIAGTQSLENLKRKKRNPDIFEMYHQSNRCERAYRICVTRSRNYIVSRMRNSKRYDIKKNNDCVNRPARIVYEFQESECPPGNVNEEDHESEEVNAHEAFEVPISQNNDSLSAVIVQDESDEGSDFYPQNNPYSIPISFAFSRPEIFPMRTPPFVALQTKKLQNISSLTNEGIGNLHELFNQG